MNGISDLIALLSNQPWELAGRLAAAILFGGLIGIEFVLQPASCKRPYSSRCRCVIRRRS